MANPATNAPITKKSSNKMHLMKQKNKQYGNVIRGQAKKADVDEESRPNLSYAIVGVLLFVVIGSAVLQMISTAMRAN